MRWDLENRRSCKALTSGIIIIIIIYIGFAPVQPHANAFDLALINNHYCEPLPAGVAYAGAGGRAVARGSRGRENRIDDVVSIIAPDKGMGPRGLRGNVRTYARIGLIGPR